MATKALKFLYNGGSGDINQTAKCVTKLHPLKNWNGEKQFHATCPHLSTTKSSVMKRFGLQTCVIYLESISEFPFQGLSWTFSSSPFKWRALVMTSSLRNPYSWPRFSLYSIRDALRRQRCIHLHFPSMPGHVWTTAVTDIFLPLSLGPSLVLFLSPLPHSLE